MGSQILTLRHSATDAARQHVILGRIDEDINEEGRALIDTFVAEFGRIAADRAISSPLKRALSTASAVVHRSGMEIVTNPLCIERDYGKLQGVEPDQLSRITPKTFYVKVKGIRHSLNPPGGETLEDVRKRAETFVDYVLTLPGTTLVVSHHCFLSQMHGVLLGQDVYHALVNDAAVLELNRFDLRDGKLRGHDVVFSPSLSTYRSW